MEITIFAKKRHSADGKTFYNYLTTLTKKDGAKQTVTVKFKEECGAPRPENCPMIIRFEREDANLASCEYMSDGTNGVSYTLWVSKWVQTGEYIDHSLDEFI